MAEEGEQQLVVALDAADASLGGVDDPAEGVAGQVGQLDA